MSCWKHVRHESQAQYPTHTKGNPWVNKEIKHDQVRHIKWEDYGGEYYSYGQSSHECQYPIHNIYTQCFKSEERLLTKKMNPTKRTCTYRIYQKLEQQNAKVEMMTVIWSFSIIMCKEPSGIIGSVLHYGWGTTLKLEGLGLVQPFQQDDYTCNNSV